MDCCHDTSKPNKKEKTDLTLALAGNANVGKSTIFNQFTGLSQTIGNWPGKTVEVAEGLMKYNGLKVKIVDLPGIYSFSTFSDEELVTREYITAKKPDIVVNVVDATRLEKNLYFTLQMIELGVPIVLVLNFSDVLRKKNIIIDTAKLEKTLGIPVIETAAINGYGMQDIISRAIRLKNRKCKANKKKYSNELEKAIKDISAMAKKTNTCYAPRWIAIKLLENDSEVKRICSGKGGIYEQARKISRRIERRHKTKTSVLISNERYKTVENVLKGVIKPGGKEETFSERIDDIALHGLFGYFIIAGVVAGLLAWTFVVGNSISNQISNLLANIETLSPVVTGPVERIIWNGIFTGFVAGVTLIIPYVLPFYFLLGLIENSGYLPRISFMLDRGMHKIGLHGKAIIPLLLGYGCNVPACFSCRIMETRKQKLISAFLITLVPCIARTIVILGLVAAFVNIWWALALYAFDIIMIILFGRIAFKLLPGESVGLIMDMPNYRLPSFKVILKQTWARTKSLLFLVFPAYIIGSALIQVLYASGFLTPINDSLNVITVAWLGLPSITGILLLFGIVRKELTLLMLAVLFGTTNFALILTPLQMIVLGLVSMLYIPCVATIMALAKEFGYKKALSITVFEIAFAVFLGGIAFRILGGFV